MAVRSPRRGRSVRGVPAASRLEVRKPPKPAAVAAKALMDTFHFGKPSETAHSADCASAINREPEVPSAPVLRRRWHGRSARRTPHRGSPGTTQSPPHGHGRPRPEPPSGQEWAPAPGACSLRRWSAPPIPGSAPRMFSSASSFYRRRRLLHCRSGVPLPGHSRDACTAPLVIRDRNVSMAFRAKGSTR
jgi:hypothetical protein